MGLNINVKSKNVNSKKLCKDVDKNIVDLFGVFGLSYPMNGSMLVDFLEEYLDQIKEEGKILQYIVICNRSTEDELDFSVKYKQMHCLNMTELHYVVTEDKVSAEDVIDYYLYGGGTP